MRVDILLLEICCVLLGAVSTEALLNNTGLSTCAAEVFANNWTPPLMKSGNKYYYLHIFYKISWYKAFQFCRYHGMDLATISSKEENDELRLNIMNSGVTERLFWTSGTDLGSEGSFYWMATGHPLTYNNFPPGQPDNWKYDKTGETENCLVFRNEHGNEHTFLDDLCSNANLFICEIH